MTRRYRNAGNLTAAHVNCFCFKSGADAVALYGSDPVGIVARVDPEWVDVLDAELPEADRLLLALVRQDPLGEWADGDGVSCRYCNARRGDCGDDCPHHNARRYLEARGLLPVKP